MTKKYINIKVRAKWPVWVISEGHYSSERQNSNVVILDTAVLEESRKEYDGEHCTIVIYDAVEIRYNVKKKEFSCRLIENYKKEFIPDPGYESHEWCHWCDSDMTAAGGRDGFECPVCGGA